MLKKIGIATLLSAVVIGLSGCGGKTPKPVIKQLTQVKPITVTFPKVDPVTMEQLTLNKFNFSNQILKFSSYKPLHVYGRTIDGFQQRKGVSVIKQNDIYSIHYDKGNYSDEKSTAVFNIMHSQKDNSITFKYPTTYTYVKKSLTWSPPIDFLDSLSKLEADSKKIFSKLNTITISKKYNLNGEVNSKYPALSIYSNFKRILGNYSYRYNNESLSQLKRKNTFSLRVNGKSVPLYIEVYPYREGSKVKYSATLPYTITTEGSNLTKQDIESLKAQIAKIIND